MSTSSEGFSLTFFTLDLKAEAGTREEVKVPVVLIGAVQLEQRLMDLTQNMEEKVQTHTTDHTSYLLFPFKVSLTVFVIIIIFFLIV